uniref:Uncharacterized protein n=1 Tax=Sipha flava TaxID=143950 RepID=A0A2S2QC28_9HEMI
MTFGTQRTHVFQTTGVEYYVAFRCFLKMKFRPKNSVFQWFFSTLPGNIMKDTFRHNKFWSNHFNLMNKLQTETVKIVNSRASFCIALYGLDILILNYFKYIFE